MRECVCDAVSCCGNPLNCMSSSERAKYQMAASNSGGSLAGSCQEMQALGASSSGLNARLSGICSGGQQGCYSTCGALISKYQSLLANCSGCSSQSIYENTLNRLSSQKQLCSNLQGRVQALANQSFAGSGSQAYSANCLLAAAMPSSAMAGDAGNSMQPFGCPEMVLEYLG